MSNLDNCTSRLRSCLNLLQTSNGTLENATEAVPGLSRMFYTRKIYGLVPELDVTDARESAIRLIEPQLKSRLVMIRKSLDKCRKRRDYLLGQRELIRGRLVGIPYTTLSDEQLSKLTTDDKKIERYKFLRNKRERLQYLLSLIERSNPEPAT
ncbi:uncharacterized protein KQ657_001308 [Scheffersomyces spartinae]|uniref:DASH complex subunit SPC19 n=1 Tax=Scheffersomyces spartinae TaxID=45513 RepID=A0A9P8AHJ8_9ASCO|nr:uncharacterized protein KQ657_001308 [Scheffersomyces spartinae]KAG7192851.1 hypothetical protein KQ657_001308 [Scheffersomyces spartinae]